MSDFILALAWWQFLFLLIGLGMVCMTLLAVIFIITAPESIKTSKDK